MPSLTSATTTPRTSPFGSIALITNSMGAALERYSYDAWGKRRNLDGTDFTANGGHLLGITDRGYTGTNTSTT